MKPVPALPRRLSLILPVPLLCGLLLLSGCGNSNLARTIGLERDVPDEFTVTTSPPLSMPPDFNLRPPRPGAARPQAQNDRQEAEEDLSPQLALSGPVAQNSAGQAALVQQLGAPAPSDIRTRVDRDAAEGSNNPGFIDKLLYWRKPDTTNTQVDPTKEAQRLRENAALGQSPSVGDTPIIQPPRKGWFSNLFSWL
jgi:hypothetical protein